MSDKSDFDKFRPVISETAILKAAETYGAGGEIRSLAGKRSAIDAFVLLLANDTETFGPFLMNATCARALHDLLEAEGFGPQAT